MKIIKYYEIGDIINCYSREKINNSDFLSVRIINVSMDEKIT